MTREACERNHRPNAEDGAVAFWVRSDFKVLILGRAKGTNLRIRLNVHEKEKPGRLRGRKSPRSKRYWAATGARQVPSGARGVADGGTGKGVGSTVCPFGHVELILIHNPDEGAEMVTQEVELAQAERLSRDQYPGAHAQAKVEHDHAGYREVLCDLRRQLLPWVTLQSAAAAVERAIRLRDAGQREEAVRLIDLELGRLAVLPASDLVADARRLLETAKRSVEESDERIYGGTRKDLRSMKRFYSMASSSDDMVVEAWVAEPSFKKRRPAAPQSGPVSPVEPTQPCAEPEAPENT